jgi:hypothetical protein
MGWMLDGVLDWLAAALVACFNLLIGLFTNVLYVTPDVTGLPQVKALTGRSVWVVDTVFVLAFLAAGALTLVSGGDERSRYTIKDLLPRLIVAFIAAHFAPLICSQAIRLSQGLTGAFAGTPGSNTGAFRAMRQHLEAAITGGEEVALMLVLVAVLVVILAVIAVFQMLARICALLVLSAFAPIALALHALPQTDPLARLWWRGYAGCLAVPVLQAFTLQAGAWMLTDPRAMFPSLGIPGEPLEVINLLIVVVLLWTTVKIPGLVAKYVRSPAASGRTTIGAALKVSVVQQAARAVPGLSTLTRR